MDPATLTFGAALLMGLVFGSGPCNVACLPYLGPVFLARPGGIRSAWRSILPFSAGRLTGYTLLGVVAGTAGEAVAARFEGSGAQLALGGATFIAGLALIWRSRGAGTKQCGSTARDEGPQPVRFTGSAGTTEPDDAHALPTALFGMGAAMALNPCMPLATVLLAAAATASWLNGGLLGLGFGLGAVVVPALMFGLLVAHIGEQVRGHLARWERGLTRAAGAMLLLLGTTTAAGWIAP